VSEQNLLISSNRLPPIKAHTSLASSVVPVMPWDLSDIAMCGWCVDGLTFSPSFLYSISIKFWLSSII